MTDQVRASHLLIKHSGSRRPASRLSDNITRSKEEAIARLLELRAQIVSGQATFEDLATQYSDCNSGTRGGDLGPFGRGMMQKPFEDATFALKVGELSNVVDTDSGVHIILRTA
ncbi:Peptidyl-prolyl cis-trans isomerase NIMA-interacting protein 1 [Phytophthora ramorum]|uniref:Peptidyl-prolyl cis-trans isomerase Pin1 n=1 Tax=Phytophthora ramorum TaxID=164328 RepID=UPI00309AFE19|nr:Peptidyl-prolyl cis-trans isomerase Pin1 [Phytophthora ramorum]KAH7508294.1 Peptidyl-prolyl cis-trans isomerase Pin1 [Phytophthora ramorum]